jgi:hypothetical protein
LVATILRETLAVVGIVLVLLAGLAAATVVGGTVGYGVYRLATRPRGPGPSELGRALGLTAHGSHEVRGTRGVVPVGARWTTERRGSGKRSRTVRVMRYWADLQPSLRMGLGIGVQGFFDPMFHSIGLGSDMQVGDPALDQAFVIKALDADHAGRVLRDRETAAALLALRGEGSLSINDAQLVLRHDGWARDASGLGARLDVLHRAAAALLASRRAARAQWEPHLDTTWGAIARTEGLTYDPHRTQLAGRIGDAWVQLDVVSIGDGIGTTAWMRFARPLGIGLRVFRGGLAHTLGAMLGGQDVQCGHRVFDDAFIVKATDPDAARSMLAGGGAEAFVKLAQIAPDVEANDDGIRLSTRQLIHDARAIGTIVRAMSDATRAFGSGGPASQGAYR